MSTIDMTYTERKLFSTGIELGRLFGADPVENRFGGYDVRIGWNGHTIRVLAVDDEWDVGVEIYLFNPQDVVLAQASFNAKLSPHVVAEIASTLEREQLAGD